MELLRNAHFKFLSPYWEAREIGQENGRRIYQPIALLSAGLTNQPNIPVRPLANTQVNAADNSQTTEEPENTEPVGSTDCSNSLGSAAASPHREIGENIREIRERRKMNTVSGTENLGLRRGELVRLQNRRDRIHECVLAKLRLGMNYDEAWEHVKREHAGWFDET